MTALALALLATLPFAASAWLAGALVDRTASSPGLRERVHALGFAVPLLAAAIPVLAPLFPRPTASGAWTPLPRVPIIDQLPVAAIAAPETGLLASVRALALDHGSTLFVLAVAIGALARLASLALRHRGLMAALRTASPLGREDVTRALGARAEALGLRPPALAVSDRVSTPVLVGLHRPTILIPDVLAAQSTDRMILVCGHELAHALRRDNVRLLGEETLLALLWFNPAQTAVHRRLMLAREEARDGLALTGAGRETRRRYAETLVEVLRLGGGPGLKTAFIGTERKGTAMRLKAILKPRSDASPAHRLIAAAVALSLVGGAGAGSLAIAAQAGPETSTTSRIPEGPKQGGFTITSDHVQQLANGDLRWNGEPRITFDQPGEGPNAVHLLVNGLPAPAGFRPEDVDPKSLAWIEGRRPAPNSGQPMTLDFVYRDAAQRRAKYARSDAVDYQRYCASDDPGEYGFCSGMIFGSIASAGACLPAGLDIVDAPDRVLPVIAAAHPRAGESMKDFVRSAVRTAFPCPGKS